MTNTKTEQKDADAGTKAKAPKESTKDEVELRPDGFERFAKAVHAAAKAGPMGRTAKG